MAVSQRQYHHVPGDSSEHSHADASCANAEFLKGEAAELLKQTAATGVAIALDVAGVIRCAATAGHTAPIIGATVERNRGITGECVQSRTLLCSCDTQSDPRVDAVECGLAGIRSVAVAPILSGVKVMGVVEAFADRPHAFSESHLKAMVRAARRLGDVLSAPEAPVEEPQSTGELKLADKSQSTEEAARGNGDASMQSVELAESRFSTFDSYKSTKSRTRAGLLLAAVLLIGILVLGIVVSRKALLKRADAPGPVEKPAETHAQTTPDLQAAESGDVAAQRRLGVAYLSGTGLPANPAEGVRWLRKAAVQGDADAQYWLANSLADGRGLGSDLVEAYAWFVLAQANGNVDAGNEVHLLTPKLQGDDIARVRFRLAEMYADGEGVPKDSATAYVWLTLAEEAHHPEAHARKMALAKEMSPAQLAGARARASAWLGRHAKTQAGSAKPQTEARSR